MKVRTSYPGFVVVADGYLTEVFKRVVNLQFLRGDGPIIAFQVLSIFKISTHLTGYIIELLSLQVENEYGAFGVGNDPHDIPYLIHLRDKMIELGSTEMFFTSDTPSKNSDLGAIPGELQTANFQNNADKEFDALDILQPGKPYMVAEFWSGWVRLIL